MTTQSETIFTYGLFRHGETVWNKQKRVQGHGDSPLTQTGKDNIRIWAHYLHSGGWQRILCSDLGRVRQTVEIINKQLQLPVTVEPQLRELHWGSWEGMRVEQVRKEFSDELAIQTARGWNFRPPGGESRSALRERVFATLEKSRKRFADNRLLVVCHLGVIQTIIYTIAGRKFMHDEPKLIEKNCMHEIQYSTDGYHLTTLNITTET